MKEHYLGQRDPMANSAVYRQTEKCYKERVAMSLEIMAFK